MDKYVCMQNYRKTYKIIVQADNEIEAKEKAEKLLEENKDKFYHDGLWEPMDVWEVE